MDALYETVRRKTSSSKMWGAPSRALGRTLNPRAYEEETLMAKILGTMIVASLLFVFAAPAFAGDAPKTEAECEKLTDMKWDSKTKTCVKK